jgi:ferric-dicitrate binding protein FerR (iron transport regulator)
VAGSFRADNVDAFVRLLARGYPLRVEQHNDELIIKAR